MREPARTESFACAYGKDIAVALIQQGKLTATKEIDMILHHYFTLFMNQMDNKESK
jgi:hypothetical protein